jgi:hypothetical protein
MGGQAYAILSTAEMKYLSEKSKKHPEVRRA